MIFLDSGILYSYANKEDSFHKRVKKLIEAILLGKYGSIILSNFVIDEALTLARVRTRNCKVGERIKVFIEKEVRGRKVVTMVIIEKNLMEKTHELYNKYCEKGLSFTDCSILAVMKEKKIDQLATTAKEFDGIVSVVELI